MNFRLDASRLDQPAENLGMWGSHLRLCCGFEEVVLSRKNTVGEWALNRDMSAMLRIRMALYWEYLAVWTVYCTVDTYTTRTATYCFTDTIIEAKPHKNISSHHAASITFHPSMRY